MKLSMNKLFSKRSAIITFSFVLVLCFCYIFVSRLGKISIQVDTFPSDTRISIDNRRVGRGAIYLKPGAHTVEASRNGFKSYSETINIDSLATPIAIMLDPESTEAKKLFETHHNDYDRVRKLSYEAKNNTNENFNKKNPIIEKLPYETFQYKIGYIGDQSDPSGNSIIVTIYASETYRQSALYRLYLLGFDPTDLNIVFKDYENPFPL